MPGLFLTMEGGEGVGKTTQLRRLADWLASRDVDFLLTREPGGTPGAEALRGFLLESDHHFGVRAEAMLHVAARIDHVDAVIRPALAAGRLVLCDRFSDSTLAYQGYGLGQGDPAVLRFIDQLSTIVGIQPDLTLILEVQAAEASRRLLQRRRDNDRYEMLDEGFHARVAEGFRSIAREAPERCVLIAASGSIEAVHQRILASVQPLFAG